jgi:radical SAM superfamily enzyme YgiQ (UPF0313 family)
VLNEKIVDMMKQAGLTHLDLSLVSAARETCDLLNRPFDTVLFREAVLLAQKAGLSINAYVIIGLPNETIDNMLQSLKFLHTLPVRIGPSIFYPVPATPLWDFCRKKGYIRGEDYDLYRLSAIPVETERFTRKDIVTIFYISRILNIMKTVQTGSTLPGPVKRCIGEFLRDRKLYHYFRHGRVAADCSQEVLDKFFSIFDLKPLE